MGELRFVRMGFGDEAGALRVSIGRGTSDEDIAVFHAALADLVARHAARTKAA